MRVQGPRCGSSRRQLAGNSPDCDSALVAATPSSALKAEAEVLNPGSSRREWPWANMRVQGCVVPAWSSRPRTEALGKVENRMPARPDLDGKQLAQAHTPPWAARTAALRIVQRTQDDVPLETVPGPSISAHGLSVPATGGYQGCSEAGNRRRESQVSKCTCAAAVYDPGAESHSQASISALPANSTGRRNPSPRTGEVCVWTVSGMRYSCSAPHRHQHQHTSTSKYQYPMQITGMAAPREK